MPRFFIDTNLAADAYEWLDDCGLLPEDFEPTTTEYQLLAELVDRYYEGGWATFKADNWQIDYS